MIERKRLSNAITLALTTSAGLVSGAVLAAETVLEEVTVTATKRVENLQDVPFAVTALGQEALDELNVANFDDYIRYLPGVNAAGRGPGQSSIFIRGMATDSSDQTSIEIGAPVPNVALYLDEQPVSSGGRNLDLYAADIARVEVLPGPQGTLFGASSMAGTVRLITNKPVYNEFQAGFKASIATTKGGDLSNSVEYTANDVGFPEGAESTVVNNLQFVEENFNDAVYTGARISANIAINDDWEALAQYMVQTLEVDGVFDHSPPEIADRR
jgi:outer membrane receptor protein involved in Fe transport